MVRWSLAALLSIAACSDADPAATAPADDAASADAEAGADVAADTGPTPPSALDLALEDGKYRIGPVALAPEPMEARSATETVGFLLGFYTFAEEGESWTRGKIGQLTSSSVEATEGFTVERESLSQHAMRLEITAPANANRVALRLACAPDEHFLGLGAHTQRLDHRGRRVPIWVQEQGLGKSEDLREDTFPSFKGHEYDSYFPVPFVLSVREDGTSFGLLALGEERLIFDFCRASKTVTRLERWASSLEVIVITGATPAEVLSNASEYLGRPALPPDWAHYPWLAVKGGTKRVQEQATLIADEGIPASAIWSEDWLGESINPITGHNINYHWEWDPTAYPELPALIDGLHAQDLKFLGYFNPFVTQGFSEWDEAIAGGFLPKSPDGAPYEMTILTKLGSVVDLTNPAARTWLLEHLEAGRALGLDGWMADFAEWVPYDAQFADGRTGATVSSDYPRLWQEVNRQACRPEDGCVFFVRSGYTGSSALSTAVWAGDQNTDFGEDDGLPTAVRIGVGLGLVGVAFYGSDIAGYTSAGVPPSTRELFFRWTEHGAWTPIMRTHEGNAGPDNWWFDEDAETLAHFKRYAQEHARLFPYLRALMHEAVATGIPPMRHPALHEPTPRTLVARDIYLLGPRVLVAPVVAEGAVTRSLGLPPGRWVDLRDGRAYAGDTEITVDAPLDAIPVFLGEGTLLPRLVDAPAGPTAALASEAKALEVTAVPGRDGSFVLADGATLTLEAAGVTADPGDGGLPTCTGAERGCTVLEGARRTVRLEAGAEFVAGDLRFRSTAERAIDLVLLVP